MTDSKIRSADDLIVKTEAEKLGKPMLEKILSEEKIQKAEPAPPLEEKSQDDEVSDDSIDKDSAKEEKLETKEKEHDNNAQDESSDQEIDDYGNAIPKAKMYTEDEVQAMIRKRLRDRHSEQTPQEQQQVQQAAKDFKADPQSEETWENQLEQFVENTISKVADKKKQKEWEAQQEQNQANFQDKFTNGMQRYKDFQSVVKGKPISNDMMMATRSMDDPAAFIYAACKQHPAELERISQLTDPYAQIASIGRLEERMKKAKLVSTTPKPSRKITGDASDKMPERSIDQLIASHAKSKNVYRQ